MNQEKALSIARKQFGPTAFTEHHVNYKRVGYKNGKSLRVIVADTWDDCIKRLTVS